MRLIKFIIFCIFFYVAQGALTTSVYTTTNINGIIVTESTTFDPSTVVTDTETTSNTLNTDSFSIITTLNDLGETIISTVTSNSLTSTTTGITIPVTSSISTTAGIGTVSTSSTSTSTSTSLSVENNGRPNPSTDFTKPPLTPVTTLSIESLATFTLGTTKTYTTTRANTKMWVTIVTMGQTTVIQTTFVQRFSKQYSEIASPSSGSIGLGSYTGEVGLVHSTQYLTIGTNMGNALYIKNIPVFGFLFSYIMCLI